MIATITAKTLTYEEYLAEGETNWRYDIIDGVRYDMPNPTRLHQRMLYKIANVLGDYEQATGRGEMILSPGGVLIQRVPLRTRQSDVLFISNEQLAKCADPSGPEPLAAAPELVVEILSPSETRGVRVAKIADYCAVGVKECWSVDPSARTITVLRLEATGAQPIASYSTGETLASVALPGLTMSVDTVFSVL
jgi:Uma2 family endonuclease